MYHVRILENQIVWETDKAFLIRYPKSIWNFWVGKKLLQRNQNSYMMSVWPDMEITLISEAGSKKKISSDEFLKRFGFDVSADLEEDLIDD